MPTLPLVPVASQAPGWESPRDAEGVTKMYSAETENCGVGLANHPLGEGTGDRPRGFCELFTASGDFGTPEGSPATRSEDGSRSRQLLRSFSEVVENDQKSGGNEQESRGGYSTQLMLSQAEASGEILVTGVENTQSQVPRLRLNILEMLRVELPKVPSSPGGH